MPIYGYAHSTSELYGLAGGSVRIMWECLQANQLQAHCQVQQFFHAQDYKNISCAGLWNLHLRTFAWALLILFLKGPSGSFKSSDHLMQHVVHIFQLLSRLLHAMLTSLHSEHHARSSSLCIKAGLLLSLMLKPFTFDKLYFRSDYYFVSCLAMLVTSHELFNLIFCSATNNEYWNSSRGACDSPFAAFHLHPHWDVTC